MTADSSFRSVETTRLGRTGLEVGVAGLGCGGHSRLGRATGKSEAESIAVVHRALDLGVNLIDTARAYGTEEIVGKAVAGKRDQVILSSKALLGGGMSVSEAIDVSLQRLQTDYIDIYFLHGVSTQQYKELGDDAIAQLVAARDAGKVRYLAISEQFGRDPGLRCCP
jgi:L-galactose dehydrogenase